MIELRSDTFTLPTEAMLDAMRHAALGDDVYGEDPTVNRLEDRAAELLGKESGLFLPSGTMANLTALLAWTPRGGRIIVGDESDIYCYEAGGASVVGGAVYHPVRTQADGTLSLADLEVPFEDDPEDPQFAVPALLCLENTHNRCGGIPLPLPYLDEIRRFADAKGIALHMDGARVFNAAAALDVPVATVVAAADTVQFCLSKGLGAPIGSMLVGPRDVIARARRLRKMLGGGMRQAGLIAAAGLVALEESPARLHEDHANARRLAAGLSSVEGLKVHPVHTNIVFFEVLDPEYPWRRLVAEAAAVGVGIAELGHGRIRAVTHCGVTAGDVEVAVERLAGVVGVRG
ncbi:threonine aldolase [Actinorhabdospora filicis]|uniref:Threonine aldolase n=1 Tax=Actinorhabdospora filicis TaxID=1785913 RepID=A0A9W6W8F4_9ACTN|nr:low-specificity L-threonine aldolase [Actinorhabdospora filicis]GLZ77539.1 threonine aldolase [Actinorhabdospora filicis]